MHGFIKEYFDDGFAAGEAKGEARGIATGEAQALVRLLEKRIGTVSVALRARIYSADLASIEAWFDRAIEATEFESVFDRN